MRPSAYRDMDLAVSLRGDQLEVRVLSSPAGETGEVRASVAEVLALDAPDEDGRGTEARHPPGSREVPGARRDQARTGAALFGALLHDEVLSRYREAALLATRAGAGLRLVLRFAGGADRLPWELLWDPANRLFLALDPLRSIVRCTEMPAREPAPPLRGSLRILLVVSAPLGAPALDALTEVRLIAARLQPVMVGAATQVVVLENASLDDIRRALDASDVHVVHYIGHGSRRSDGRSLLELTAADGSVSSRPAEDVAAVLASSPTLRLAVLNCCHGSTSADGDPFAGAAATLVKAGIPAVVAMRRAISDRAAVTFAADFYDALAAGSRIERAVAQGRAALFAAEGPVSSEWWTVALHLGSSLDAELTASPLPHVDADVHFSVARPTRLRVAMWEPLLVFAHHGERYRDETGAVVDQRAEVEARIAGFYGEEVPHVATTAAALEPLPRGAALVVVPDLPGLDCDPSRMPLTWTGEISEVKFLVRAGSHLAGSTVTGWVRIFCGPLVIAETELALVVEGAAEAAAPSVVGQPVRRYTSIFPCFAPEDAELVESVVAVAEALGDRYTLGVVADRRAGAPDAWMRGRIGEADSFQLFWSTSSMTSETCRSQWEAAVATGREDFIRPLYWQDPFPRADGLPPPALAALRFVRLPVAARSTTNELWAASPPPRWSYEPADIHEAAGVEPPAAVSAAEDRGSPPAEPPPSLGPPPSRAGARWVGTGLLAGIVLTAIGLFGALSAPPGLEPPPAPGEGTGSAGAVLLLLGIALVVVSLVVLIVRRVSRRR